VNPIHVEVSRRKGDYVEAFRAVMGRRLVTFALLVIAAMLVIETAFGGLRSAARPQQLHTLLFDAICAGAIWAIGYWLTVSSTARRMYAAHSRITGATYTFDDAGMQYASSKTSSFTNWTAFSRVTETPNLFLLMYPNRRFQLIPKRCVADGRAGELGSLLREKARRR